MTPNSTSKAPSSEYSHLDSLTETERRYILTDLAHWKCELIQGTNDADRSSLEEYLQACADLDDVNLIDRWYDDVGNWALSRNDVFIPKTVDAETWLDYQFGLVLGGRETEYGFVVSIHIDSLLEDDA